MAIRPGGAVGRGGLGIGGETGPVREIPPSRSAKAPFTPRAAAQARGAATPAHDNDDITAQIRRLERRLAEDDFDFAAPRGSYLNLIV